MTACRFRIPFFALALALSLEASAALPPTPDLAMERFVAMNNGRGLNSAEGRELLAGELESYEGSGVGRLPLPDKIIQAGPDMAVARMAAQEGSHPDLYFYLRRNSAGWTITALRSLALTGVLEELILLDRQAPSADPEMRLAIRNAELVLSSDRALIAWAAANRDLLEQARAAPASAEIAKRVREAGLTLVARDGDLILVTIGGILDNEVGFLWAPEGAAPAIDASRYIWVEPIGGGWHLFKTT